VDTLLLVVTILSLSAAFVSFMAVRKLKRNDQLRSDARVAALMAAADAPAVAAKRAPRAAAEGTWNTVAGEMQWNPEPAGKSLSGETPVPATDRFFGTVQREHTASPRFAFAAAFAMVVALGGAVLVFTGSNPGKAAASAARTGQEKPLELVSLGHSRDASSLVINGIVRNPSDGRKREGLTAVVSLIDGHGGLISTKDVPLDYRALGPGEEAPFKILVPDPGSVARYRVSFRAGTDVVPHVDRRTDAKLASAL
jgi:hypothetical protein